MRVVSSVVFSSLTDWWLEVQLFGLMQRPPVKVWHSHVFVFCFYSRFNLVGSYFSGFYDWRGACAKIDFFCLVSLWTLIKLWLVCDTKDGCTIRERCCCSWYISPCWRSEDYPKESEDQLAVNLWWNPCCCLIVANGGSEVSTMKNERRNLVREIRKVLCELMNSSLPLKTLNKSKKKNHK